MKIAVVGSRDYPDLDHVVEYITHVFSPDNDILVSGRAAGVDSIAEMTANRLGIKKIIFPAEWSKFGRQAGFVRNKLIAQECDRLVAFWYRMSGGTGNTIHEAKKLGKEVLVIEPSEDDDDIPF